MPRVTNVGKCDLALTSSASGEFLESQGPTARPVTSAISTADVAGLDATLALKAPLASPTFTGIPAGPTASPGTSTTQFATTAFVAAGLTLKADAAATTAALATKADDSAVVHKTGTESIDGIKNFSGRVRINTTSLSAYSLTVVQTIDTQDSGGIGVYESSGASHGCFLQGGDQQTYFFNFGDGMQFWVNTSTLAIAISSAGNVRIPNKLRVGATLAGPAAARLESTAADASSNAFAAYSSDGTKATVIGPAADLQFQADSSTTIGQLQGRATAAWVTSTHASRKGRLTLSAADFTGTDREGVRVESDGTQALVGFFGSSAVAKPVITGSRAGNAALASLLTALASLGLITDSTSA